MEIENNVDEILNSLVKSGRKIKYLKELKEQILSMIKKDEDLGEVLGHISREIKEETEEFLNSKNEYGTNYITGISTCIYLPDFKGNGEYKLKLIGGKTLRTGSIKVNEETLFDVDSITKLFTLLLLFKLEELKYLNLDDKICDINPDFQNLGDFTLNDLVGLHGEFRTNGNIAQATSKEEAYEILKTLYLVSDSREENKYNDFGMIVIGDTIEKVLSNIKGEKVTFEDVMYEYLLCPLGLYNTQFNPNSYNLSGNGNKKRLVYNNLARLLGGAIGSAGIFTTSDDLARLSKALYRVNYVKHGLIKKDNLNKLESIMSCKSFYQGYTGSNIMFDKSNLIHSNILVNAVYEDQDKIKVKDNKPFGFGSAFEEYQKEITKNTILMYVTKQYYNKYCNVKENIDVTKYIK